MLVNSVQDNSKIQSMENKCMLYIFEPRQVDNRTIRPLIYDFQLPFIENITEACFDGTINRTMALPEYTTCVKPAGQGIDINLQQLSGHWSFMMVCDGIAATNETVHGQNLETSSIKYFKPENYRIIYTGIFSEEPVNPRTLNNTVPIFNQSALFRITRKSLYKKTVLMHSGEKKSSLITDQLIPRYDSNLFNSDHDYFLLNPENLDLESDNLAILETDKSLNIDDNQTIESKWQSPKTHVSNICQALDDVVSTSIGSYEDLVPYGEEGVHGMFTDTLKSIDSSKAYNNIYDVGFRVNALVPLNTVLNTYNPNVLIIRNQQKMEQLSVVPGNLVSPETVYGSLLESNISTFLLDYGLSSISITYESFNNLLEVFNIESIEVCTQEQLKNKFNACWSNIKSDLLTILKITCGDYHLKLFSSISGNNLINLVFYDYQSIQPTDYMRSFNPVAGLSSNMIGTGDHVIKNVNDLNILPNHISAQLGL